MIRRSQTHELKLPMAEQLRPAGGTTSARWIVALLLGQLLWIFALAANPGLHEWAHHHHSSGHPEHHCVVDFFSSGTCEATVVPTAFTAPVLRPFTVVFPEAALRFSSQRQRTGVLEHAPPALS